MEVYIYIYIFIYINWLLHSTVTSNRDVHIGNEELLSELELNYLGSIYDSYTIAQSLNIVVNELILL